MAIDNTRFGTVLLVEDESDVRETLADILKWEGYGVFEAANGRDALATLRGAAKPCLIILDLMMPVMNGWEFSRRKAADPEFADVPMVIVSGVTGLEPEAVKLGAKAVIAKPVDLPSLLRTVGDYCR
ncbi:MAG TPA: response regulator [Armatimonadota bacterium]|jgi:CheY-like chemotaxis protein